ncbi:MAG: MFS transporter [Verrucomicrobia bacterium]|nr:MFS transporter [Verrucomicrobiota bacterium]
MSTAFSKSRSVAYAAWMIASIFYAYQYIIRVMPNIMLGDIMQQFQIDAAAFGQFSGVYYIGYSLMHLPLGILLDRFGPRKVMSLSILLTVVGLLPLIFASHWAYPVLGRLLIGIGSSGAILGLFKIIRMIFDEKKFSRMLSLSVTIGLVGAIYGGGPVSMMRDALGYKAVTEIFALAGIALAAITYWIVPPSTTASETAVLSDLKEVLSNKRVIWASIFGGLMVGPLEGFADVWGSVFLKQACGIEGTLASSLPSLIFMGMCFGAPVLSYAAEKTGSYLGTIVAAGIFMTLCFAALLTFPLSSLAVSIGFVLVGVCCAYQILAIYKASTFVREGVAGLTTAIANMIIMLFGYVFHTAIGQTVSFFGGPETAQALVYGVAVIPIALFLGSVGFTFLFAQERRAYVRQ